MTARPWSPRSLLVLTVAAMLVAVCSGVAACGSSSSSTSGATGAAAGSPKPGGSLTLAYQADPNTLDPAIVWDIIGTQIEHQIYRGALAYTPKPDGAGLVMIPDLATEVPTDANGGITNGGKTFTFHLRQGVMFQAPVSREVTADDFKYSFERMMGLPLAPATYFYTGVVGAEEFQAGKAARISGFKVVDRYTFQIDLKNPDPAFLKAFGGMDFCDVVPKEWVEKWGKQFNRHPLGTGPFVFDHWTPGQEIVLKRNPTYWDKSLPYLDQLRYVFSYDPQTAFLKMQRGEVDVLLNHLPTPELPRVEADPNLSKRLVTMTKMGTQYLFMNTQLKPFDNVKVRQAISWAVNREKLAKLLSGQGEALYQIYPKGMPGYVEGKKYYGYDPAKAKQLLAEAGYAGGFKTMLYSSNLDPYPKLMQSIQADLAAVGIKAEIKTMNDSTYNTFVGTPKSATMGVATWMMDFPDPSDWIIPFFSKSNAVEGGVNSAFWWTPEMEQMISKAQTTTDEAARTAQYEQMQEYIMGQAPYVTLYEPVEHSIPSTAVGGFYLHEAYEWDTQHFWRQ